DRRRHRLEAMSVCSPLIEIANPDVAEADRRARITVRLELDRRRTVFAIRRRSDIDRLSLQLDVILHEYAVLKGCDEGWRGDGCIVMKRRRYPDDIVRLPFARFSH